MLFAADYPFLDLFWSMIIFFCWVAWIWMVIAIFSDIFRRHDASGAKKAIWCVFIILIPFLGALIYLIANGDGMGERQRERVQRSQTEFAGYVQSVAGSNGVGERADEGQGAARRRHVTQAEFDALKAKVLA